MLAKNLREDFEQVEREKEEEVEIGKESLMKSDLKHFQKSLKGDKEKSLSAFKALNYYLQVHVFLRVDWRNR